MEQFLNWRWNFWIQLIFGVVVQVVHFFTVPETRSTVMLDKKARQMTKANKKNHVSGVQPNDDGPSFRAENYQDVPVVVVGPNGGRSLKQRLSWKEIGKTMWRPYHSE